MESQSDNTPLIVIVGETASGKSALALDLATQFNGEIIAADSRTVYKGMDIGTAKPSVYDQSRVPHHLLDITTPDKPITAAEFKKLAEKSINDIAKRGKLPLLVGGTGLYIDAIVYDFDFAPMGDPKERKRLQSLSVEELQSVLSERNIPLPVNSKNPRHLIRRIEAGGAPLATNRLRPNTLIIGVQIDRDRLSHHVERRIESMFENGLVSEVKLLSAQYGWQLPVMQTIGYQEFEQHKEADVSELKSKIKTHTLQYAKRQRTWFRRNKSIHWITQKEEAVDLITTFLNK